MSDLLLFHKFICELIPVNFPEEIIPLSPRTRSHADASHKPQVKCEVQVKKNVLCSSYFIRAVHHWNLLPDECKGISTSAQFRSAIMEYLWSLVKKR